MKIGNSKRHRPIFESFFMGGFECATHRRRDRTRIDVISSTGHDRLAAQDFKLLAGANIRTVRDGLRWHLIEKERGVYDWSSFLPVLIAAINTGTQVIWDLCHWGVPPDLNLLSPEFPIRFANFARAAATLIRTKHIESGNFEPQFYCAINEISFWAWVGGDEAHFEPYLENQGPELKRQLVRASIEAIRAVRAVDPETRFVQPEPIIHISAAEEEHHAMAAAHTASQYEAWDMLAGIRDADLGGAIDALDILGVNYYWNNQWIHEGDRTPPGHSKHRPLHLMLNDLWKRYGKPILLSETGAEMGGDIGWLGYICAEVRQAQRMGIPILGICLYPVMDYPGWDDDRHCQCGLIETIGSGLERRLRSHLCQELKIQQDIFSPLQRT